MMWQPDPTALAAHLTDQFGVALIGNKLNSNGSYPSLEIVPLDGHPSEAFRIIISSGWRSLEFRFEPGAFAGELISQMGTADAGARSTFARLAEKSIARKGRIAMNVDGQLLAPLQPEDWPSDWRQATIALKKSPATVNTDDTAANDAELLEWTRRFVGLVLALVPIEERESEDPGYPHLPEGAVTRVEVNRYERSRFNRAACIELLGSQCLACEFSFGDAYGSVGEGFIEVHHLTPVSQIGAGYVIDPLTDLVPLCPNCHSIAHKRNPPYSVSEIRKLIQAAGRSDLVHAATDR